MMLGSTVSSDWKSSPASGWMSILAPVSTSLTATGWRLSVGELAGTTTSDAFANERQPHLDEHLFGLARPNRERRGVGVGKAVAGGAHAHSGRGGTSGNVTWPTVSLIVSRDHDVAVDAAQLDVHLRDPQRLQRDRDDDAAGPRAAGCERLRRGGGAWAAEQTRTTRLKKRTRWMKSREHELLQSAC